MSNPNAKVELNEYMVACYGTTEYPEDMNGIKLSASSDNEIKEIIYEYRCREEIVDGGKNTEAVIDAIDTKVSLYTDSNDGVSYIREGYAFSPMFTLGLKKNIKEGEVCKSWLKLEKAN